MCVCGGGGGEWAREGKGPATHYMGQESLERGVLSNPQWGQTRAQLERAEGKCGTAPDEEAQGQAR